MRLLFLIFFLIAALPAWSQSGCFKAIQNGQEVTIICTGIPVYFEDCTANPDPNAVIFYDPGPGAFNPSSFDESKLVKKGNDNRYQYTYTQAGTYRITQIINKEGGVGTTIFERTFEVKASSEPAFTAISCANRSVQVRITDNDYDLFDIDFGDGTIRKNVEAGVQPAYTYTTNGPFRITLTGRYSGATCEGMSQQPVELLPAVTAPVITRLEVIRETSSGELAFNLENLQPGYLYVLERFTAANYQAVDTIRSVTQNMLNNYRVAGINTVEATRYRVRPIDRCGTRLTAVSKPVSSITLNASAGEELATLAWTGFTEEVKRYEISRNGNAVQSLDRSTKTYTDRNLSCGQNYCYTLTSFSPDGKALSVSAQKCIVATSTTPPPAGYLYSTYDENSQVTLLFKVPQGQAVQQVQYQRSIDGSPYRSLAATNETQVTDKLQAPTAVCYRASYTNACNLEAALSNTSCPVFLKVVSPEDAPAVTLGWTGYVGFPDGIGQYTVELLDDNNSVLISYPATGNTFIDRDLSEEVQLLRYRIKVTSGKSKTVSYSNTETVKQPLQVHVPTAFTPNQDGLNDVLEVKGRFIRDFRITIYNSMGHVVFQSNDRATNWDGTYQGKLQPAGAYAYEINIITTGGEEKRRTGTVTLLR